MTCPKFSFLLIIFALGLPTKLEDRILELRV